MTNNEIDAALLAIAERMHRQSIRLGKIAIIDDHQKTGLAQYLRIEAANLTRIVESKTRTCADGHTSYSVGCVSCVLVHRRTVV